MAEVGEGPELDDADGADALAEDLGDVLIAEVVDETHDDDLALLEGEIADLLPDALAIVFQLKGAFRGVSGAFGLERFGKLGVAAVLKRLLVVDGEVAGDAKEPGNEGDAARLVARDCLESVEEGLRGEILGEKGVAGKKEGVPENSCFVAFVENAEGFAVATRGV